MIVYSGTISKFNNDVDNGIIADLVKSELEKRNITNNNQSEFRSWDNSLLHMKNVLDIPEISKDIRVAIEYQIPATSKRVDFIIAGKDENDKSNVVIIELKQWETAKRTSREDIVTTYLGGANRAVTHPSYQAYSYAKTIENYNEYVQKKNIELFPCCFLHNYREEHRSELDNDLYSDIIKIAPMYLKQDTKKLREFIRKYVSKSDNGELLYQIDHGKIRPSKALQDTIVSMINGNQEFYMIDEQKVVFSTIKKLVENAISNNKKYTIIIEGGPGTGKSVIAMNLLAEFRSLMVNYVTKNAAPRNVYFSKMRQGKFKLNYVKNLFKGSGAYVASKKNDFDCLIVDEAHRLNEKSGMFANLGENQIKEIINASRVSVFFIDEDQIVTTKDFGSINEIKKQAKLLGSEIFSGEDYRLTSQFRCNGSDGYIAFLDHILGIRDTANYDGFDLDYDIRVYDDPVMMRDDLRGINHIDNKSRMIAGYCYEWVTQKNNSEEAYDIELENGFKAKWNFSSTNTWAIDEDSFEQVGCIHTAQGLEFDYVGIIIGKDLRFENGKVITDYTKRAKSDASLRGIKSKGNYELADCIIRNTYKTLLSRGQKGCFVYCEDKELSDYMKNRLANIVKR
ncbi:DUF2075 domain-containing protein [Peloplasma aerotolerans]|uniref:DUF2075 domain-containing protein n=1 Tax=Peloplasma aerotolerans TaxID=3044389 RepID=A0AAW6UDK1_9MOLU|nr:DUF2075 domain-containing protein [Mariniplasma sp. M4Ah]MDI6453541.1 DUF2075 domain-containing protein [Mariniplasma sp. M4Ah]